MAQGSPTAPHILGGLKCSRDGRERGSPRAHSAAPARGCGRQGAARPPGCCQTARAARSTAVTAVPAAAGGNGRSWHRRAKKQGQQSLTGRLLLFWGPDDPGIQCQGLLTSSSNNLPGLNLSPASACPGNASHPRGRNGAAVQAPGSHAGDQGRAARPWQHGDLHQN